MRKLQLKPGYALTDSEVTFLASLPNAAHDTKFSTAEQRGINGIYYRLFGNTPYGQTLTEQASKSKWPGGERKAVLACQRDVLDRLAALQISVQTPIRTKDDIALLLGTMLVGNPLAITLVGLTLESADVTPTKEEYLALFNEWATGGGLPEIHSMEFLTSLEAEWNFLNPSTTAGAPSTAEGHE